MAWARWRPPGRPRTGFGTRPVRVAASVVVAALVVLNSLLVYRLSRDDATPRGTRVPLNAADPVGASTFRDLRDALQSVQASFRNEVEASTLVRDKKEADGNSPGETSTGGSVTESASTGSGASGDSSGSDSSGTSEEPPAPVDDGGTDPGSGGPGGGGAGGGGSGGSDSGGGSSGGGGGGG